MSVAPTTACQEGHDEMSAFDDAEQLAELLRKQRTLTEALESETDPTRRNAIRQERRQVRLSCVELVNTYLRLVLHPILLARFPQKVSRPQKSGREKTPVGQINQFTQLLNDFFVKVLSKFDDPFWRKTSAIELRNYASIAISNGGIRDALRRRSKQENLGEEGLSNNFEDQLAIEIVARFKGTRIDPADAMEIINRWQTEGDNVQQNHARILRLFYVAGMSMEEVQHDMNLTQSTAYRRRDEAIKAVREQLEASI